MARRTFRMRPALPAMKGLVGPHLTREEAVTVPKPRLYHVVRSGLVVVVEMEKYRRIENIPRE